MMNRNDYDQMMRLLIIGNSSVGKTCLLRRFAEGNFSENFIPTVGIDFSVRTIKVENKNIKVQIFDTAGQERFKSIISSYFRNADGILMVYDVTDKQSFEDIEDYWLRDIMVNCPEGVKLSLVGNKADLVSKRAVPNQMGNALAQKLNIPFIETSAKTEQNVNEAFEALVRDIFFRNQSDESAKTNTNNPKTNLRHKNNDNDETTNSRKCC